MSNVIRFPSRSLIDTAPTLADFVRLLRQYIKQETAKGLTLDQVLADLEGAVCG